MTRARALTLIGAEAVAKLEAGTDVTAEHDPLRWLSVAWTNAGPHVISVRLVPNHARWRIAERGR